VERVHFGDVDDFDTRDLSDPAIADSNASPSSFDWPLRRCTNYVAREMSSSAAVTTQTHAK
jgi:hypothetical protein